MPQLTPYNAIYRLYWLDDQSRCCMRNFGSSDSLETFLRNFEYPGEIYDVQQDRQIGSISWDARAGKWVWSYERIDVSQKTQPGRSKSDTSFG